MTPKRKKFLRAEAYYADEHGLRLKECLDEIEMLEKERDGYKKAKEENDERFMIERDEARAEAWAYKETLKKIASCQSNFPGDVVFIAQEALKNK